MTYISVIGSIWVLTRLRKDSIVHLFIHSSSSSALVISVSSNTFKCSKCHHKYNKHETYIFDLCSAVQSVNTVRHLQYLQLFAVALYHFSWNLLHIVHWSFLRSQSVFAGRSSVSAVLEQQTDWFKRGDFVWVLSPGPK